MRTRVLWLCVFLFGLLMPARALADTASLPRFESGACPFTVDPSLKEGADIRCGYLVVPEHHSNPGGKTLRLAVAIVKSGSDHPAPDPVFFLNGGPGDSTLAGLGPAMSTLSRDFWVGNRDLVLIDQRGTGFSTPKLDCTEFLAEGRKLLTKRYSFKQEDTMESQAVAACRARLAAAGVDLSAYTSAENAADIADLRVALGYSQVNLYGISYGTRLALSVMRYFPTGIRSVVLDSVYRPGISVLTDPLKSGARDFNLILKSCAAASICGRAYPKLRSKLYSVIKNLDKKPAKIAINDGSGHLVHVVVAGEAFIGIVFQAMYAIRGSNTAASDIVLAISDAYHRKFIALQSLAQNYGRLAAPPDLHSDGMYLSVECSEDSAGITPDSINVALQSMPLPMRKDAAPGALRTLHDCQVWNVPPVAAAQTAPVVSDIPTMVMEGEYDPITPPEYGATAAQTLSHNFSFVYPGVGHGTRFAGECPSNMMWQFIDKPTVRPDDSCIASMPEPFS